MTPAAFYRTCLALWGEDWRPELTKLLAQHGMTYSRMSFWYWQHGKRRIPDAVAEVLKAERVKRQEAAKLIRTLKPPKKKEKA